MMIKVLDTGENFFTSEKKNLNPSLEAKVLKIDNFFVWNEKVFI